MGKGIAKAANAANADFARLRGAGYSRTPQRRALI